MLAVRPLRHRWSPSCIRWRGCAHTATETGEEEKESSDTEAILFSVIDRCWLVTLSAINSSVSDSMPVSYDTACLTLHCCCSASLAIFVVPFFFSPLFLSQCRWTHLAVRSDSWLQLTDADRQANRVLVQCMPAQCNIPFTNVSSAKLFFFWFVLNHSSECALINLPCILN